MVVVGALVILASVPVLGTLLWMGTVELVPAWRRRDQGATAVALGALAGAATLAAAPFVAWKVAEARHDWVDADGNGFLDPMANGSGDWFDVNGGTWFATWSLIAAATLAVAGVVALLEVRRRHPGRWDAGLVAARPQARGPG